MSLDAGPPPPPGGALIPWRQRMLVAAGVGDELARQLAGELDLDLHALLELVDRGCPPLVAARILTPLERERP